MAIKGLTDQAKLSRDVRGRAIRLGYLNKGERDGFGKDIKLRDLDYFRFSPVDTNGTGKRMSIAHTRAMVSAALEGKLKDVKTTPDPVFGVGVPESVPGVPAEVLQPRNTWADKAAYDAKAKHLADLFRNNFKQFEDGVSEAVKNAGPNG